MYLRYNSVTWKIKFWIRKFFPYNSTLLETSFSHVLQNRTPNWFNGTDYNKIGTWTRNKPKQVSADVRHVQLHHRRQYIPILGWVLFSIFLIFLTDFIGTPWLASASNIIFAIWCFRINRFNFNVHRRAEMSAAHQSWIWESGQYWYVHTRIYRSFKKRLNNTFNLFRYVKPCTGHLHNLKTTTKNFDYRTFFFSFAVS